MRKIGGDARRYSSIRYRLMVAELVGWPVFMAAYMAGGMSERTAAWASASVSGWPLQLALYLLVFGVCALFVFLPLRFYGSFMVEHRFGLSRMTVAQWIVRELKQLGVSGAFALALLEGWYALIHAFPYGWPIAAALGWVGVSIVLARIFPTVLLPIFYKTPPLADAALSRRLLQLCERAGVPTVGAFHLDLGVETRKANAALAGLGASRRVLLSDTLLERFTPEEIETVLGHELGHQRYRHITKMLCLSAIGSAVAFGLVQWSGAWWIESMGLADPVGFPIVMLVLSVLGFIGLPLQSGLSRMFEWQADRFAVTVTSAPHAFASALRKLSELNLADPAPPSWVVWLFYDHPPITDRIAAAESASA